MTRSSSPSALLALLAVMLAAPAPALESDRQKPMDINADHFESSTKQGVSTLTGNVRIVQGTLKVQSEKAVVHQDEEATVTRAVLNGSPAQLEQDLDEGGHMVARAKEIDYDLGKDTVVLTGDVVVEQPRGELRGEKITYELATGRLTGSGEGAGKRVHLRMNPGQDTKKDG